MWLTPFFHAYELMLFIFIYVKAHSPLPNVIRRKVMSIDVTETATKVNAHGPLNPVAEVSVSSSHSHRFKLHVNKTHKELSSKSKS